MTEVRGDELFVRRWGGQDGRALIFLHALGPASSAAFVGLGVQSLVEAGYAVTAPDLPGYGRSAPVSPEEYEVPALAERMAGLADDLGWATSSWSVTVGAARSPVTSPPPIQIGSGRWSWSTAGISTTPTRLAPTSPRAWTTWWPGARSGVCT